MKKYLFIALASLFAFASCSKESNESPEMNSDKMVTLSFTSKRPNLKSESKTAWDGSTIVWSEGDKIRIGYTLDGHWMNSNAEADDPRFYASKEVTIESNESIGTFVTESSLTDPGAGAYVFYAYYPRTANDDTKQSSAPEVSLTLPTNQTPASSSFDGSADIMLGKSASLTLEGLPTDPVDITWNRVVAHADLTFKNLAFVGTETVSSVTLVANEGAKLTGAFTANLSDGSFSEGSSNKVVINGTNLTVSGANLEAWCCILPVTITSLDVEVVTNKAKYTRSISGISKTFKQNARNTLAINMATAEREESTSEWVKKNLSEITSSDVFVIVGNNGSNYAMSNDKGTGSAPGAVAITVSGNKLAGEPTDNLKWTLSGDATDGYTFYPLGSTSTWLYCTNTNNGVRVGTNTNKTFKLDNGYLKHVGTSRFVGVYNSGDWRCYTSINDNIKNQTFAFYVKSSEGGDTPTEPDFTTVAELNALATATATEFTGKLTNAVISFVPDNQNAVIKDATGSVLVYKTDHGYLQGQTFSGDMTVTVKLYNSCAEITSIEVSFTGSETNVDPEVLTLSQLVGNLSTYQNAYAKVSDLTIKAISGKNMLVTNGSYNYYVYASEGVPSGIVEGDIITASGTITHFGDNDQIRVWSDDGFVKTGHEEIPTHTITWSTPSNGSFTVSVDGSAITSGSEVQEGKTVTLTATPNSGYVFSEWTVTGATVSGNTSPATFVVGTSDVTFSATFIASASSSEEITGTFNLSDDKLSLTTASGLIIVQEKGTGTTPSVSYNTAISLRVYVGNTLTFSGKTIKKIEFTHAKNYAGSTEISANSGTYTRGTTTSTWEGSSNNVVITNTGGTTYQLRPTKIVVTYE